MTTSNHPVDEAPENTALPATRPAISAALEGSVEAEANPELTTLLDSVAGIEHTIDSATGISGPTTCNFSLNMTLAELKKGIAPYTYLQNSVAIMHERYDQYNDNQFLMHRAVGTLQLTDGVYNVVVNQHGGLIIYDGTEVPPYIVTQAKPKVASVAPPTQEPLNAGKEQKPPVPEELKTKCGTALMVALKKTTKFADVIETGKPPNISLDLSTADLLGLQGELDYDNVAFNIRTNVSNNNVGQWDYNRMRFGTANLTDGGQADITFTPNNSKNGGRCEIIIKS